MRQLLLCLLVILFYSCTDNHKTSVPDATKIVELESFRSFLILDGKLCINMSFILNQDLSKDAIDSTVSIFAKTVIDTLSGNYAQIGFSFYKESAITNERHLKDNPRDLDRYSQENDLIWTYNWQRQRGFVSKTKYHKGEIVNARSDIKVEDIQ